MEPYYLAIGMTHDEFWYGDVWLAKVYREAHNMKIEMRNQELYMQGYYNYSGFAAVIANFAKSFSKNKGGKQETYLKEPVRLTPLTERERKRKERRELRELRRQLDSWKKPQREGGNGNG